MNVHKGQVAPAGTNTTLKNSLAGALIGPKETPMIIAELPTQARKRFIEEVLDYLFCEKKIFISDIGSKLDNFEVDIEKIIEEDAATVAEAYIYDQEEAGYEWSQHENKWV